MWMPSAVPVIPNCHSISHQSLQNDYGAAGILGVSGHNPFAGSRGSIRRSPLAGRVNTEVIYE